MKNIGIVTVWSERGAGYVSKQYEKILKKEFNTFIYARGEENYAKNDSSWNDQNVTWAKKTPLSIPSSIDKNDFINWIKKNNIEIIFFNEQHWWPPIVWCKELGVMVGSYIDYYTEETIPLFEIFDFLICNTKRHFSAFSWHKNVFYIPWGTDVELFSPKSLNIINERFITFFHSAGMSPNRKGTEALIKAFSRLKGDKKLIIHSQIKLEEKLPYLKEIINNLMANNELEIINETVSAPGLYFKGDIYVYPSKLDGIGLTMAEAISCGLPIIVPDNPPMNEFVNENTGKVVSIDKLYSRHDGYFWPQCEVNIDDLALKMQYYIDHKSDISKYKEKARKEALKLFNWENNTKKIVEVFKSVTFEKRYDSTMVERFEMEGSSVHWLRKLYIKSPLIFKVLSFLVKLKG
jgi:glycosyltransferase involved in cell wall biosynthesis